MSPTPLEEQRMIDNLSSFNVHFHGSRLCVRSYVHRYITRFRQFPGSKVQVGQERPLQGRRLVTDSDPTNVGVGTP